MENNNFPIPQSPENLMLEGDDKVLGALCYPAMITVIAPIIIFLMQKPDKKALRFHALQGITAHIAFIVLYMIGFLLAFILFFLTFGIGNFVTIPLLMLLMFGYFGISIYWAFKAYSGEPLKIPYITDFVVKTFQNTLNEKSL